MQRQGAIADSALAEAYGHEIAQRTTMGFAARRGDSDIRGCRSHDARLATRTVIASTRATNPSWITPIDCAPDLGSLADQRVSEEKLRLILVVRAAAELDVVGRRRASSRVRRDMMELEERNLPAPSSASDERAASLIALPHCSLDSRRYVDVQTQRSRSAWLAVTPHRQTCAAPDDRSAASTRDRGSRRRLHLAAYVG